MAREKKVDTPGVNGPGPSAAESENAPKSAAQSFFVVGIGASAGGLAAFEAFFSGMPADTDSGMAFVLVQHLAPDHKSLLSELVKRYTHMQVFEVEDGMKVRPNCAYIIPPNRDMAFLHGALQLLEPAAPRGHRLPIDFFFRSLAQDQRERAICIVLSGTGSDGTLGLRAVKGEGGMAMTQNPESAEYDGMPRSAIGTGLVDYVLPPAEMPAQLIAYAASGTRFPSTPPSSGDDELKKIYILVRAHTGHDFSQYKRKTIYRRIERRMAVHQIAQLDGYVRYLGETPAEVEALFRDLLIGVTHFFRDAEAFEALETQVIPQLVGGKSGNSTVRVWVAGCSTGEEAYSIAILLREKIEALKQGCKLQVFATDIDPRAIATARAAVYPASIATDITQQRLERYFLAMEDGQYRVHDTIRDLLVFSEHDVTKDPPFSRMDLISFRNVMIYMGANLQKKVLPLLHYGLNPGGTLFLGSSETVGEQGELFSTLDSKAKLYLRQDDVAGVARPVFGKVRPASDAADAPPPPPKGSRQPSRLSVRQVTEQALLEDAPVAALIDERGELLYLHGHTGQYLAPAPGEIGVNILTMAREGLRHALTSALHKAALEKSRVFQAGVRVKTNGDFTLVNLTVRPVSAPADGELQRFLVNFEPAATAPANEPFDPENARILELQQEVRIKDEYLNVNQERMQTSNEELRSTNEELQSTNEELQSTNEELETSKEELQSVNEELATVNAELQSKVTELSRVNNDMNNLLAGTGIGTIFVDLQLCIRRFTPAATQFINLIQSDIGRPLSHIMSNLQGYDQLIADVRAVVDTLIPREVEVQTHAGAWFLLRTRPYRTSENVIEGAVITFNEVTALKLAQAAVLESNALRNLAGAVRDALDAITVQDLTGRILAWNPGASRMYGWTEAEALGMNVRALIPEAEREQALAVVHRLSKAEVLQPYRTQRLAKTGQLVEITLTATALVNGSGAVYAVSTTERGMSN